MKSIRFPHAVLAAALAAASLSAQAALAPPSAFTGLYIFGDSLSDNGNNLNFFGGATGGPAVPEADWVPTLPYSSGVYSNGPVWVNSFAAGLGLAPFAVASRLGGGDYASGGAKVGTEGAAPALYPPSLKTQLNTYLGSNTVSPTALYVVAGGGNDVRATGEAAAAAPTPAAAEAIVGAAAVAYATDMATIVGTLKAFGAQHLVVWNVPDVGLTPAARLSGFSAGATQISSVFNIALSFAMAGQSGVTIFDTFGLLNTIASTGSYNGVAFGNRTDACGYGPNLCDPSNSLFWDGIHPTAHTHGVLAGAMLTAVPEPSSMLMLAVGIGALLAWRRRA